MSSSRPQPEADPRGIFERFSRRLIAVAHSRLDSRTRQKVDPEDVVQSVFRSFFTRRDAGQLAADNWDDLWRILVVFTVRKCARKATAFRAARRDVRRESEPADGGDEGLLQAIDREPKPEEVAMLVETMDRLLSGANETEREIVLARLDGYGPREISERLDGVSERRVYRVLAQVRKRLEADAASD